MKPLEDAIKDGPTAESVVSQDVNVEGLDKSKEKANPNNSDKPLDVNNSVSPVTTSTPSNGPEMVETDKSASTININKDGSIKTQNTNDSETRGRKMTSVNFLPCDCKLCGEKFTSDKALGYHIRDVHVVGKKDKKEGEGNRKKKPKDYHYVRGKDWKVLNPKRPYCCSICSKRFLYESSLNHHKVVKHNEKIDGGNASTTHSNIPPKMYNHTFQCDQCGKILMSKHSLIRHLVSFHGTDHEKPFQCDICGQRYVSISSLVSHRRKEHTGDKPYVCEHCGKAFTMANRLKCHLRVHSDEKFYKCQQCSKQFKSCSAFRAHKDTHLGVMRHTCKYCERKFLFQGNMIKHIRRRHPNGEKSVDGSAEGGESGPAVMNSPIDVSVTATTNNLFTSEGGDQNVPIAVSTAGNSVSGLTVGGNSVFHSSVGTTPTTMTVNSVPVTLISTNHNVTASRRSNNNNRYLKSIQTPDHSYFTKEVAFNIHSHPHMDVLEHQNMQSLSPLEHFAQPEIQFQVLPLLSSSSSSLPNQELFNGINNYQSTSLNQTNSGATSTNGTVGTGLNQGQTITSNNQSRDSRIDFSASPSPVKCRLCDQEFSDIRFHINDFHRIPMQKVESMMPTMIYF